jgi:hypothetical protein
MKNITKTVEIKLKNNRFIYTCMNSRYKVEKTISDNVRIKSYNNVWNKISFNVLPKLKKPSKTQLNNAYNLLREIFP